VTLLPPAFGILARLVLAVVTLAGIGACGSGAVSAPPVVVTPGPITILPDTATLYSELPTTFVVSGGNGNYIVTSSNQAVVPVVASFTGVSFTVVPNPVAADTPVTLTVRDTVSTTPVTATLTVKPRTVSNVVAITPSASQSAACGSSVCAGGDAEVRTTLTQAGIPLRGREVRFDVVSGDFRIITSPAGAPETLSLSGSTLTDSTGTARMRIRVLSDASPQTALLQITDTSSGFFQRTSVGIAPSSNAPLNAQPDRISFVGPDAVRCASGIAADVVVFGGRPPYSITQPGTFQVSPVLVTANGGRFTVTATGQCSSGSPIAIVDNNGATVTVTAANALGTSASPTPMVVSPSTVTLDACSSIANVTIAGGQGPGSYFAAAGSGAVVVGISGSMASIRRQSGTPAAATPVQVGISDGRQVAQVTVNLSGPGAGACP
jgi:hypothetical protein